MSLVSVFRKILLPYLTLIVVLVLVQIFIYSGDNSGGFDSMPIILAEAIKNHLASIWPILAPLVGAIGSFVAGSATVSNLLFSGFQYETAILTGFEPAFILALQGLGAGAGNMIALHNVVAGVAVAGLVGRENEIIRKNMFFLFFYLFVLGLLALGVLFFGG